MKYVKLFEDIKSDGYEELSHTDFYDVSNDLITAEFTKNEIDKLSSLTYAGKIKVKIEVDSAREFVKLSEYSRYSQHLRTFAEVRFNKSASDIYCQEDITIFKMTDEWFDVKCVDYKALYTYWKCDQIDGVMDLLKNEYDIR